MSKVRTIIISALIAKWLLVIGFVGFMVYYFTVHYVIPDWELYKSESKCVSKLIALEVERRDIWTDMGTCGRKGVDK